MITDDNLNLAPIVETVLPYAESRVYKRGDDVIKEGFDAHCLYFVARGGVEVSSSFEGVNIAVAIIGEGKFFGEIGFFDGISRVRNVRATENTEIRLFEPQTMKRLQHDNPFIYGEFISFLARSICEKFRRVLDEREPLTGYAASLATGGERFEEARPLPENFLKTTAWRTANQVAEKFKARLFDLSYKLQQPDENELPENLIKEGYAIIDDFNVRLREINTVLDSREDETFVWGYLFKEFFPYLMRSRMAERVYFKPKGYAGDFMMMEMIYGNKPDGDGKLGKIMDGWFLASPAADAVRERRKLLAKILTDISRLKVQRRDNIRIMNLACGSNRELFDFLSEFENSQAVEALCIDIDPDALAYTNRHVNIFNHQARVRLMNENIVKWALGRVRHNFDPQDIIYSSGLTDYLDNRLFVKLIDRCYEQLRDEGVLIIGNFGPNNPNRQFMDHMLHWILMHRDARELKAIFKQTAFGDNTDVLSETHGINLFVVATKR